MTKYPEFTGLETADEVIDALKFIAEEDNTDFMTLWEDGFTEIHDSEEVKELIKTYIREHVDPEDLEDVYYWGEGKIIMN